ncbi:hypothetical protein LZG74_19785 [Dyadobacter sp. CY327]|uniref:hypothetical protein n=1 Tax=Dyadobacter sp. CY327 TaxID=2907301 RepID=UPI001F19E5E0|nr:hypothetical protein [Dyadobacter sp. CY327]MCE7072567.1 hypothetical protein [Dyadobacter sp. CY327]
MKIMRLKLREISAPILFTFTSLAIAACDDRSRQTAPIPRDPLEQDSTKLPEPPATQPGQDTVTLPNMPVELYGRFRMQWAPTDYREVFYEAKGLPVRIIQENQYVQGSDITRKTTYDFVYDAQARLIQLKLDNGAYVKYYYEGSKLIETREHAKDNLLLITSTYAYAGDKITQIYRVNSFKKVETQFRLLYDQRGNLIEYREYAKNKNNGLFDTYSSTKYSGYDNKRNVENLWMVYPFLPGYSFASNNAGVIRFYFFDGNVEKEVRGRKTITYEYLENGYPSRKAERGSSGSLETTYSYKGL